MVQVGKYAHLLRKMSRKAVPGRPTPPWAHCQTIHYYSSFSSFLFHQHIGWICWYFSRTGISFSLTFPFNSAPSWPSDLSYNSVTLVKTDDEWFCHEDPARISYPCGLAFRLQGATSQNSLRCLLT